MLVTIFYPLLDGGIQQTLQVFRILRQGRAAGSKRDATATPSSDSSVNQVGTVEASAEHGKQ